MKGIPLEWTILELMQFPYKLMSVLTDQIYSLKSTFHEWNPYNIIAGRL